MFIEEKRREQDQAMNVPVDAKADTFAEIRARMYERYRSGHRRSERIDDRASRAPYLRHIIRKHFPLDRDIVIIDLGCGSGSLVHFLREAGYGNVSGVDTSYEQVAAAQALDIQGIGYCDSLNALRSSDAGSYDVVVSMDVIEHLTKAELLVLGDEVYRVLKPEGTWLIHAPNAESPFGARIRYADLTHEQSFTTDSLSQFLEIVGFKSVRCYEDQPIVHGLKSGIRWLIWKALREALRLYLMIETGNASRESIFSQNVLAVVKKQ